VHQVLGTADVDRKAALPVFVGDRRAAHQLDDRGGVDHRVNSVHRRGAHGCVGDVTLQHLQLRTWWQRRRGAVEGTYLVPAVEQGGHQVGADKS
jgi:hypothetical protein